MSQFLAHAPSVTKSCQFPCIIFLSSSVTCLFHLSYRRCFLMPVLPSLPQCRPVLPLAAVFLSCLIMVFPADRLPLSLSFRRHSILFWGKIQRRSICATLSMVWSVFCPACRMPPSPHADCVSAWPTPLSSSRCGSCSASCSASCGTSPFIRTACPRAFLLRRCVSVARPSCSPCLSVLLSSRGTLSSTSVAGALCFPVSESRLAAFCRPCRFPCR